MTTPQAILYDLSRKLDEILRFIEGKEEEAGLIGLVKTLEEQNDDIVNSVRRLEEQMTLIIRVLSRSDEH